jgi:hypothetical protein
LGIVPLPKVTDLIKDTYKQTSIILDENLNTLFVSLGTRQECSLLTAVVTRKRSKICMGCKGRNPNALFVNDMVSCRENIKERTKNTCWS